LCAAVSAFDALMRRFRPATVNGKPPRAIVVILLFEMGSLVLAHDMFARLKQRYPDAPLHALLFRKNREILDLMQVNRRDLLMGNSVVGQKRRPAVHFDENL
jgi:hypothetical protein